MTDAQNVVKDGYGAKRMVINSGSAGLVILNQKKDALSMKIDLMIRVKLLDANG